jgi:hypothetical protein
MAWLAYPCFESDIEQRDVAGVRTPPKCRVDRPSVAFRKRMVNNIHRFVDPWEE